MPDRNTVHFRVWAPGHSSISVIFKDERPPLPLDKEEEGYFSGLGAGLTEGMHYKYLLDNQEAHPDPASRFQPFGPHSWSAVVNAQGFQWTDAKWRGIQLKGQVLYEMHLGTFTPEGTWKGAAQKLEYLRETGITTIELMPIADFPGKYGWGYDGVALFAPAALYGEPDDMRAFVDQAHAHGIAVILDVVYNHLGPDGNYLSKFSPYYFSEKYSTDWGVAINFDAAHSKPVREFFRENAAYWIREFHLDGLRLDATQDIHDDCDKHILAEIAAAAREAAGSRGIILIGENEPQETRLIRPTREGGYGLDALWNDDYHHTAVVALTGKSDAYYTDYNGSAQELLSCMKYGYLFQGQRYRWQKQRRGTPALGLPHESMVTFIENHDQVANSARGQRLHVLTSPGKLKAMTALTLLGPGTPMLFQGQEFAASARFLFFADHKPELAKIISNGRADFLGQWRGLKLKEMQGCFADPCAIDTFEQCRLNHKEVESHSDAYAFHRDLLRVRRDDPVISRQGEGGIDGAVLTPECFLLRYFTPGFKDDRLLLINLGKDLLFDPAPEPLLAPPLGKLWSKLWSSEDPQYGGCGTPPLDTEENWRIPGEAAVLLQPVIECKTT